jgi:hypothetical protein
MGLLCIQESSISEAACHGFILLTWAFITCLTSEQKDIVFKAFFQLDYLSTGSTILCPFQLAFMLMLWGG